MKPGDVIMVTAKMAQAFHRIQEAAIRAQEADNPVDQEAGRIAVIDAAMECAITTKQAYESQDDAEVLREDK